MDDSQPRSELSDPDVARKPDRAGRACKPNGRAGMVMCWLEEDSLHAVHIKPRRSGPVIRAEAMSCSTKTGRSRRLIPKRCTVVALLPKSAYLLKTLEIPPIPAHEVHAMLALESEAALPPEYGPIEISYRRLPSKRDRYDRYEVYIARRDAVSRFLSELSEMNVAPDLVLPSAVAWQEVLSDNPRVGVLVVNSCLGGNCEIAMAHDDGAVSVRTVAVTDGHSELASALSECMRSRSKDGAARSGRFGAAWLGREPAPTVNGAAILDTLSRPEDIAVSCDQSASWDHGSLLFVGALMSARYDGDVLRYSSLLPQELARKKSRGLLHRNMAIGTAAAVLAMVLASIAVKLAANRYRNTCTSLGAKIAQISKEGDFVGQRILQLAAVREVWLKGTSLQDTLTGLYDATQEGVSYSSVDLSDTDTLRLRGHAESLSLPFILPQKLENQPMFTEVVLRDAGQSKRAGGTVAEFRIDCRLVREREQ